MGKHKHKDNKHPPPPPTWIQMDFSFVLLCQIFKNETHIWFKTTDGLNAHKIE